MHDITDLELVKELYHLVPSNTLLQEPSFTIPGAISSRK